MRARGSPHVAETHRSRGAPWAKRQALDTNNWVDTSSALLRNNLALRDHAAAVRGGLAVVLLLLVWWGPVPWTNQVWAILVVTVAAFVWLEWLRRRTAEEFPDAPAGEVGRWLRVRGRLGSPPDDTVGA